MFRYIQFILTLALLSVVTHPSVAQDTTTPPRSSSTLVSGNYDESFELALSLDPNVEVNGENRTLPAAECGLSFTFAARNAAGGMFVVDDDFTLAAGDFEVITLDFSDFNNTGPSHVIIEILDVHQFGSCRILSSTRLVDDSGATRARGCVFPECGGFFVTNISSP